MLYSLEQISEFANGGPWSDTEYVSEGIRVVKVTNMRDGAISPYSDDNFLPLSKYESYKQHELKTDDIIVATVGSHPTQQGSVVGRTALVSEQFDGSFLNQNAVRIRVNASGLCCQKFLFYLTNTILFKHHIESRARGSANQVRMALGELKKFQFDFPDIDAQKKIAAILSAYDELIENNRRRIAVLEKLAEELYREWFVRLRFPGHEKVKLVKGVPEGWTPISLSELASFTMGQSPSSEFYNEIGDGLPFHQGVGTYGPRFPSHEIFCSTDGRLAHAGDILFSVRAPVGRLNIANRDLIIGRGLAAVRHKQNLQSYLFYLLKTHFANEDVIGNGSIFNSVGKDELVRFKIYNPQKGLDRQFNEIAAPIDKQMEALIASNESLRQTRDLLLPRLISGKLSVEELDIQFPPGMLEEGRVL